MKKRIPLRKIIIPFICLALTGCTNDAESKNHNQTKPMTDNSKTKVTTKEVFTIIDGRETKWNDVRLSFNDWTWFMETHGTDTINGYYINGYAVETLVKILMSEEDINPNQHVNNFMSEADTCYIIFNDYHAAMKTQEAANQMINDINLLRKYVGIADSLGLRE